MFHYDYVLNNHTIILPISDTAASSL